MDTLSFKEIISKHSDELNEFLCDTFCLDKADISNVELNKSDTNILRSVLLLKYWHSDVKKYLFYYDSSHPDLFFLVVD